MFQLSIPRAPKLSSNLLQIVRMLWCFQLSASGRDNLSRLFQYLALFHHLIKPGTPCRLSRIISRPIQSSEVVAGAIGKAVECVRILNISGIQPKDGFVVLSSNYYKYSGGIFAKTARLTRSVKMPILRLYFTQVRGV